MLTNVYLHQIGKYFDNMPRPCRIIQIIQSYNKIIFTMLTNTFGKKYIILEKKTWKSIIMP